jgi:hypothetical protein
VTYEAPRCRIVGCNSFDKLVEHLSILGELRVAIIEGVELGKSAQVVVVFATLENNLTALLLDDFLGFLLA